MVVIYKLGNEDFLCVWTHKFDWSTNSTPLLIKLLTLKTPLKQSRYKPIDCVAASTYSFFINSAFTLAIKLVWLYFSSRSSVTFSEGKQSCWGPKVTKTGRLCFHKMVRYIQNSTLGTKFYSTLHELNGKFMVYCVKFFILYAKVYVPFQLFVLFDIFNFTYSQPNKACWSSINNTQKMSTGKVGNRLPFSHSRAYTTAHIYYTCYMCSCVCTK